MLIQIGDFPLPCFFWHRRASMKWNHVISTSKIRWESSTRAIHDLTSAKFQLGPSRKLGFVHFGTHLWIIRWFNLILAVYPHSRMSHSKPSILHGRTNIPRENDYQMIGKLGLILSRSLRWSFRSRPRNSRGAATAAATWDWREEDRVIRGNPHLIHILKFGMWSINI